ncbi:MAG: hypothetical protein ACREPM_07340, partial [Gemmatimonadaceae bacterium]
DQEWAALASLVRDAFASRTSVEVTSDRASLTLAAGGVRRHVLEPELFMMPLAAIRDELVASHDRASSIQPTSPRA